MSRLSLRDRLAQNTWRIAPKRSLSRVIGWCAQQKLPFPFRTTILRSYARIYGVDSSEAELPIAQYRSLQELFTRRLRPGVRPMPAQADLVASPSDGTICDAGIASDGRLLVAKGAAFTLRDLLADDELADRLKGGAYLVIYLSPRDYHRVHFPLDGTVVSWTHVPGTLFPVGGRSLGRVPGLFARNERLVTVVDGPAGRYVVVMVAAVGVGNITVTYDPEVRTHAGGFANGSMRQKELSPPRTVIRGEELGIFNLGSTTITIFEPGRVSLFDRAADAQIRIGNQVGRIIAR